MTISKSLQALIFSTCITMLAACSINAKTAPVLFSKSIVPILESRCAVCHMTGEEPGEMALVSGTAHASLLKQSSQSVNMKIVEPGAPAQSYLILKLEGKHLDAGGQGARMPFASPPLSDTQLKLIHDWIEQGAIKN